MRAENVECRGGECMYSMRKWDGKEVFHGGEKIIKIKKYTFVK